MLLSVSVMSLIASDDVSDSMVTSSECFDISRRESRVSLVKCVMVGASGTKLHVLLSLILLYMFIRMS